MKFWNQEALSLSGKAERTRIRGAGFARVSPRVFRVSTLVLACWLAAGGLLANPPKSGPEPVILVVMDPLAKELACACVKGHGQRDYRKLAARLETALKQRVSIEFSDDLRESMVGVSPAREVIIVGDQSLVAHGAKKAGLPCHPVCELT